MTPEELDAIEARAKAATPGPWRVEEHALDLTDAGLAHSMPPTSNREVRTSWVHGQAKDTFLITPVWVSPFYSPSAHVRMSAHDATFVATARTDVPALVAEVRRLRSLGSVSETLAEDGNAMLGRAIGHAETFQRERDEARAEVRRLREALDAARALVAKIPHEVGCPGNRHIDCGLDGDSWCCVRSRSREECLRRKTDCDCLVATWRDLLGVPVAREDGR